jgi:transcription elongation factor Elf1
MAIVGYIKPGFRTGSFTCPHCNCFSQQEWRNIYLSAGLELDTRWTTSSCLRCGKYCFWENQRLVWPVNSGLPDPIDGCPTEIVDVYDEARRVFPDSPRAAAALLRLAIQMVCREKGLPGKDLNADIGILVRKGLPIQIQQSLDLVRVVGNNAVHPGQIVIEENKDHIEKFFGLVNLVVEVLIVQPARVSSMFDTLVPQGQKDQIAARDGKP